MSTEEQHLNAEQKRLYNEKVFGSKVLDSGNLKRAREALKAPFKKPCILMSH